MPVADSRAIRVCWPPVNNQQSGAQSGTKEPRPNATMASEGTTSHGRLGQATVVRQHRLDHVPIAELADELQTRINQPRNAASRSADDLTLRILDGLRADLGRAINVWQNRFSPQAQVSQLDFVRECWQRHRIPIVGATHVDLGCGSTTPLGRMFTHLMLGVERAIALDLDAPQDPTRALRHLADLAREAWIDPECVMPGFGISRQRLLDNLADVDLQKLSAGDGSGLPNRLQFHQRSLVDTGLPSGSVDVVVSNSVLEHVPDLDAMFREAARITKPGGFGVHGIDYQDHRHYWQPSVHPLQFLADPDRAPIVHVCNRKRAFEVEAGFRAHGFVIVERRALPPLSIPPALRAAFVEPWRSMPDEEVAVPWVQLLVQRR